MGKRRRLALLAAQVDETHQKRFVNGFLKQAFSDDFDVCVFSMYRKYQSSDAREKAETNIYNLFDPTQYDGVVVLKDSLQTSDLADRLENKLNESFSGPVLIIDRESKLFPTVLEDDYNGMAQIVNHMIEVHGYKDIAYLSGKKWHLHSLSRLHAYEDTMLAHGLKVDESRIFHGDFWFSSGEFAVKEFASGEKGLPEAIVCANDEMAIGVCNALTEMGIKIPDEVAVAGFDTAEEGQLSPLFVTSSDMPYEEMGSYASYYIKSKIEGENPKPFEAKPRFLCGETCGCKCSDLKSFDPRRKKWPTCRMAEERSDVYNMMSRNLMTQTELSSFFGVVYSYVYQIPNVKKFSLCLSEPWRDLQNTPYVHITHNNYPSEMILAVNYDSSSNEGYVNTNAVFDTKDLIPYLDNKRSKPTAFFITPFYFETENFGYAVLSFGDEPISYDETFRQWMDDVSVGFEYLRRAFTVNGYQKLMENMRSSKFFTKQERYNSLGPDEKTECDLVSRILDNNLLSYVFQPIVSATTGEIFAYEALMRSSTEEKASPLMIVKYAGLLDRLEDVERATFVNILSSIEKEPEKFGNAKIFINSIPGVQLEELDLNKVNDLLTRNADRMVVEFTEEAEINDIDLPAYKSFLEKLGVQIAIDDFGTGYSNINNLIRYMPNYVKIDRFLLTGIDKAPQKQHFVREIIKFCHDNKIVSLAEGIETTEELRTVIHMGVDLIQGYYTAKPAVKPILSIDNKLRNEIIRFAQEKDDGYSKMIYESGNSNRVSLSLLSKGGYSDIVVGKEGAVYKNISIIGAPNLKTDLHMRIVEGYTGEITLENVDLSNIKERPCIEIEEGCDLIITLKGNNTLHGTGIKLAKTSTLTFEGEGNLTIDTNDTDFYGIGNDSSSEHGELIFSQNGKITVTGSGNTGVGIGSVKGGSIKIRRGLYSIRVGGTTCVGIGSFKAESSLDIYNCNINLDLSIDKGVGIGSLDKMTDISIEKSSVTIIGSGNYMSCIGTCSDSPAGISIKDSRIDINISSDNSTCIGSLNGMTDYLADRVGVRLEAVGKHALGVGGMDCKTKIKLIGADTRVNIHNSLGVGSYATSEDISISNGRFNVIINEERVDRDIKFET